MAILKQNEHIRLEIFANLLSKYLNINVAALNAAAANDKLAYENAFFLGHHEASLTNTQLVAYIFICFVF